MGEGVVAAVGASEGEAGEGDGLVRADVLVGEGAGGSRAAERDRVPADHAGQARGAGDVRDGGAVVGLVGGADARDGDRSRGDGGGEAGRLGEAVVAAVGAGEGEAARGDGLARAGVLVGEGADRSGTIQGDGVPADHAGEARRPAVQGGRGGAVVRLVGRGHAEHG
ncbi:MAG: hypothetical protein EBX50_19785, partial [Chitinophagia bacterium]|nr:hypothetical protein [Chitinophagia bacterium]